MTPARMREIDDFLERLLERSESVRPLEPDETEDVLHCMRELLDALVARSSEPTHLPVVKAENRRLLIEGRRIRRRCRIALDHLEHEEVADAIEVLRDFLAWRSGPEAHHHRLRGRRRMRRRPQRGGTRRSGD